MRKYLLFFLAFSFSAFTLVSNAEAEGKHVLAGQREVKHTYVYEQNPNTRESVDAVTTEKIKFNLSADSVELKTNLSGECDKYYTEEPRAWLRFTDDLGRSNATTRLRLMFHQARKRLGLSIEQLKYPFEIETQLRKDSWFLPVWQQVEIICTLCFPF